MGRCGYLPAAPITTITMVPGLIPCEGRTVSVTTTPEPVVSVMTPGWLPVFVTLVRIELARVGLSRSAAAEGKMMPGALPVLVPIVRIEVASFGFFKLAATDGAIVETLARVDKFLVDVGEAAPTPITGVEEGSADSTCDGLETLMPGLETWPEMAAAEKD